MTGRDWAALNTSVIEEFRANGGVVARFGGLPVIILHTVGARSGEVREVPLIPVYDDEQMMVYGTAAGSPTDPAWCHNLRAHPRITVEDDAGRFTAVLRELPAADAMRLVRRRAASTPQLAEYVESAAPRSIPVFAVDRI